MHVWERRAAWLRTCAQIEDIKFEEKIKEFKLNKAKKVQAELQKKLDSQLQKQKQSEVRSMQGTGIAEESARAWMRVAHR